MVADVGGITDERVALGVDTHWSVQLLCADGQPIGSCLGCDITDPFQIAVKARQIILDATKREFDR